MQPSLNNKGNVVDIVIGDIIRKIRNDQALTQPQIAELLGVSAISIHSYEKGKRNAGVSFYKKLIGAFPTYSDQISQVLTNDATSEKESPQMSKENEQLLIRYQQEKIDSLEKQLAEKNTLINHKPKERPKTLDEISDMLHDSSKQFSFVFYNSDKPMSCTRKGILRNVNPALCKLLGYTEDEMLGKNLLEFVHPDDHKRAVKEIKKSTRNIQLRVRKSNGKYCNMDIRAQEFGVNGNVFSVGLITCCEKGCPDI